MSTHAELPSKNSGETDFHFGSVLGDQSVGKLLYGAMEDTEAMVQIMSTNVSLALAKLLQGQLDSLSELSKEQIAAQKPINEEIQAYQNKGDLSQSDEGHVSMLTQKLNNLNNEYDQKRTMDQNTRDQITQAMSSTNDDTANVIANAGKYTQVINPGLTR